MARTRTSLARSSRGRAELRVALAASLVLIAAQAAAARDGEPSVSTGTGGLVIVVRTPPPRGFPEAEERARAELVASGLAVELRTSDADAPGVSLADDVRGHDAFAALRVVRGDKSPLLLTIAAIERASGVVRLYDFPLGEPTAPMSAARAGLLVAEHLYALRQEIRWPSPPEPAGPPKPVAATATTAAPPALAREGERGWSARVGGTVFAAADAVRPGVAVGATVALATGTSLALVADVELAATAIATEVSAAAGATDVRFGTARASVGVGKRGRFAPFLLATGGALAAHATAEPLAPHVGHSDDALVGFVGLELGATIALSRAIALRLAGTVARAVPTMRIELGGDEAARIGAPALGAASLAIAWSPR